MKTPNSRVKKRDSTPNKQKKKHKIAKSFSSGGDILCIGTSSNIFLESVSNLSGSPIKESPFVMDPMLEAALDFDDDEESDGIHENGN